MVQTIGLRFYDVLRSPTGFLASTGSSQVVNLLLPQLLSMSPAGPPHLAWGWARTAGPKGKVWGSGSRCYPSKNSGIVVGDGPNEET